MEGTYRKVTLRVLCLKILIKLYIFLENKIKYLKNFILNKLLIFMNFENMLEVY